MTKAQQLPPRTLAMLHFRTQPSGGKNLRHMKGTLVGPPINIPSGTPGLQLSFTDSHLDVVMD
jgi:hypothetical protein